MRGPLAVVSLGLASLALSSGLTGLGCRANPSSPGALATGQANAAATEALPGLKLTDETQNLLLTWIAEDGDFHVEEAIDKVPAERRSRVRVVQMDQAEGSGANVYVADLTVKRQDGTYAVNTLPRGEWEKLGADLRKTRMEALAPGAKPGPAGDAVHANPSEAGSAEPNLQPPSAGTANGAVTAIVYGADWCKPCHDAERYLKSLGVSVTKKNIEESRAAQAEMQQKLARAKRAGSSIPVIDVMGRIFVGYSPGSLKQAVEAARQANAPKHG
jgi:glutaredoxin